MSAVDEIAERFVSDFAEINPIIATSLGIAGYDHRMTDLSPSGFDAQAELTSRTLTRIGQARASSDREKIVKEAMIERLTVARDLQSSGAVTSDLNVISSPLQEVRQVFDQMPLDGEEAQRNLVSRLREVRAAYTGLRQTYLESAGQGQVAPRRQVAACAKQCSEWAAPATGYYQGLAGRVQASGTLRAELDQAAQAASAATAEFGQFLESELLPLAPEPDAAGRERFALASRLFLGATIDADEAYAWAWAEVQRIEQEMRLVAAEIVSGGSVADAVTSLDSDPSRRIAGREALREWMQGVADSTITQLDGTHFDIPEPARRIECKIAPTGDGGIYYTGPSEDWPGRAGCGGHCQKAWTTSPPGRS